MKKSSKKYRINLVVCSIGVVFLWSFILALTAIPVPVSFGRLFILLVFTISVTGYLGFLMGMLWIERLRIEREISQATINQQVV